MWEQRCGQRRFSPAAGRRGGDDGGGCGRGGREAAVLWYRLRGGVEALRLLSRDVLVTAWGRGGSGAVRVMEWWWSLTRPSRLVVAFTS